MHLIRHLGTDKEMMGWGRLSKLHVAGLGSNSPLCCIFGGSGVRLFLSAACRAWRKAPGWVRTSSCFYQ